MATIHPFPGIRYQTDGAPDVSKLIAPPYDVLDDADKAALLAKDAHNFVAIDLPHLPPKAAGPQAAYAGARATLDQWLKDGVLVQDETPAIYVYHQTYTIDGAEFVRKMFAHRLKLEAFGSGSVCPHEQTFGGPKEDRLALTQATEANMSPIFGLYPDGTNAVAKTLDEAISGLAPVADGVLDHVRSRMWCVTDAAVIELVRQQMADKPIYIADGHHRYGTGLLYRDWLMTEQGALRDDHPANAVLCVSCALEDPGLQILPTHRVLPEVSVDIETLRGDAAVEVVALEETEATAIIRKLADFGPQAIAVCPSADSAAVMARPKDPKLLESVAPDRTSAWQALGVSFLHAYVIDRVVRPQQMNESEVTLRYIKSDPGALDASRETNGTAFLLQATTMEELSSVCAAGDLMPQKSTYFYPKIASGMVVNPLR